MSLAFRMGVGYDVHRLTRGRPLILGGVEIPFHKAWPDIRMPMF